MTKACRFILSFFFMLFICRYAAAVEKAKTPKEPQPVVVTAASPSPLPEKEEVMSLITEDNASSDIVLDSAWGNHEPFDATAIVALPAAEQPKPKVKNNSKFSLSGILWSGARPSAVINDQVVGVDTVIYGMTVKEIKENSVLLINGDDQQVLSLHQ